MSIQKSIYLAGMRFRNGKIFDCYASLKESEGWSLERLRQNQLDRLKQLLDHAYRNSPHYQKKFDAHGFHPCQLKSLEDLPLVPVTLKEEVLDHCKEIQLTVRGEKMFFSETSGSTGRPLVFYRNQEWDAWHNASVMRGYSWHGVSPWEKNGYLWGYNIAPRKRFKVKMLDLLQNRFRLFSYEERQLDAFLKKLESAAFLNGYSSMVYEVARRVNATGSSHRYRLKMVKGTSEKIYDAYRVEVEKAFGIPIVSEYGSAEGGIIAFECAKGSMHINMETVIVEQVDDEVVLTNLVSSSFPIIRYKLGDYIRLGAGGCACGMAHPVIEEVTGRVGAVIRGKSNSYPSLTLYYVFKNLASEKGVILNYQAIQRKAGELELLVENQVDAKGMQDLDAELAKYFGNDLEVAVRVGVARSNFNSKKKDFVSEIGAAAGR